MTEMLNDLDAPSDAELVSRVRGGEVDAYGELFARHVGAARRLARQLARGHGHDAEDLVSDAFAKVMGALRSGGGPDIAFRAYLLTAVRRLHVDRIRAQARLTPSDDLSALDPGLPFQDTAVEKFESGAAARAFASLPERWQMVLWHLEVEQQKPADVAPLLGMTPNSVSALAYRAREGLRQAFLSAHLAEIGAADCRWTGDHLSGYVRNGLSRRDAGKVAGHLEGCRTCSAMHLELVEVNDDLRGVLAPLVLGGFAAGYLATGAPGAAAGAGALTLLDRAKDFVLAHAVPLSAGTTAAGVAAAVVVTGGVGMGGRFFDPDGPRTGDQRVAGAEAIARSSERTRPGVERHATGRTRQQGGPVVSRPVREPVGPTSAVDRPDAGGAAKADTHGRSVGTVDPGNGRLTDQPSSGPSAGVIRPSDAPASPSSRPDPPTARPTPAGAPQHDLTITADGTVLSQGIGRFRVRVSGLPVASGPTPLHLAIGFDRSEVRLEAWPSDCSPSGDGLDCAGTSGATWNGIFDADMRALAPAEEVTISVTVSSAEVDDPEPGNNTDSVTLTRWGTH